MIIARDKKILQRWHAPTGVRSSSYSAEKAAIEAALKWLESENDWHRAVLVCDCKSLVDVVVVVDVVVAVDVVDVVVVDVAVVVDVLVVDVAVVDVVVDVVEVAVFATNHNEAISNT